MIKKYVLISLGLFLLLSNGVAQHRGDNLSFQGFPDLFEPGVKALAMGGAYSSITGDINSLFYNPAGLADMGELQVSISANGYQKQWQENQNYRPNRIYWTMPFYLEGLYIPDPANNGRWDYEFARDSSYIVNKPQTAVDPFSEEAADWTEKSDKLGFNYLAAALPLKFSDHTFVISAAYRSNRILDYDRNDTYLDPHIGFDEYGVIQRVVTDTASFSWSAFERSRYGQMNTYMGAVAYDISESFKVGVGLSVYSGESDDSQSLFRVGHFDIAKDNRFRFTYDTLYTQVLGTSEYSGSKINFGGVVKLERVNLGFNIYLPYTLERKWNYNIINGDAGSETGTSRTGKDELQLPATFTIGGSITPIDQFTIAFDYEFTNYSRADLKQSLADSTTRSWVDQNIIRFGVEYRPWDFLSVLAGYRNIPDIFVPDGAAVKDQGPSAKSYTFGVSIGMFGYGVLDIAYEYRQMKYYDSYFSNTNYVMEKFHNLAIAYTLLL